MGPRLRPPLRPCVNRRPGNLTTAKQYQFKAFIRSMTRQDLPGSWSWFSGLGRDCDRELHAHLMIDELKKERILIDKNESMLKSSIGKSKSNSNFGSWLSFVVILAEPKGERQARRIQRTWQRLRPRTGSAPITQC